MGRRERRSLGLIKLGAKAAATAAGFEYGVPEAVAPGPDGEFWYEPLDGVDGDAVPVVIDAEAWVPAGSEGEFLEPVYNDNAGDLLGAQGGFQLGHLSLNAGIGAGR